MNIQLSPILWLLFTIGVYICARVFYRRHPHWWSSPMLVSWIACSMALLAVGASYKEYSIGTSWLMLILGPVTIAFAIPIYEQRELIRKNWHLLALGLFVGCTISILSAWLIASILSLTPEQEISLMPRSITMPFAMAVSQRLGGIPELTALLVTFTGLFGASIGEMLLMYMPLRSVFAKGAMFGMGAHGLGVAKACEIGHEEGAVAGVTMIFAGLINIAGASLLIMLR